MTSRQEVAEVLEAIREPAPRRTVHARLLLGCLVLLTLPATGCGDTSTTTTFDPNVDVASASGSVGEIQVDEAYIPAPVGTSYETGENLMVELVMVNDGAAWDSVVSGSSPAASRITFSEGDLRMDFLSVPNEGQRLESTVRLAGITRALRPGQEVPLTLRTQSGDQLTLQVPVRRQPGVAAAR